MGNNQSQQPITARVAFTTLYETRDIRTPSMNQFLMLE